MRVDLSGNSLHIKRFFPVRKNDEVDKQSYASRFIKVQIVNKEINTYELEQSLKGFYPGTV